MNIIKSGKTPDGHNLVIEEWKYPESTSMDCYLVVAHTPSKMSFEGSFTPKIGRTWRWEFKVSSLEEAEEIYAKLEEGAAPSSFSYLYDGNPKFINAM